MSTRRRRNRLANGVSYEHSSDDDSSLNSSSSAEANNSQERDLTPEEMDKLVQFQDITGMEDIMICRALLESNNWDLETTARQQLNLPQSNQDRDAPPLRPIEPHPEAPEARLSSARPTTQNGEPRNSRAVVSQGFFSWALYIVTLPVRWPFSIVFRTFSGIFNFVFSFFGYGHIHGRPRVSAVSSDPLADVQQFRDSFEAKYGMTRPDFFFGSYSQVLERAKQELQFLLVYLHCESHEDTDRFCRSTLSNPNVLQFIENNNILCWGCAVDLREGYRVSQAVRETTYPFLALIVLRQNRMMIVGRFEGLLGPEQLIQRMEAVIRDNEAFIVAAKAERQERQINQQIRMEQDAALQESLRQDQEKERKKREEEEKRRQEQEAEQRAVEEAEQRKELIRRLKIEYASFVPEEPDSGSPDTIRILIKLPNGQRLERRFSKHESLKSLFFYVFCHPDSPDEFEVTTNFPRKVVPCRPHEISDIESFDAPSFVSAGLTQSTTLFVNDLEA